MVAVHKRGMGEFLTELPTVPLVENVEDLPYHDIKQAAAARTVRALRRLDRPIGQDATEVLNEARGLASQAYHYEKQEALREKYRRRKFQRPTRSGGEADKLYDKSEFARSAPQLPDPSAEEAFRRIEDADECAEALRALVNGEDKHVRRAVLLMIEAADYEDRQEPLPTPLRMALMRARKRTGLPLDITALRW